MFPLRKTALKYNILRMKFAVFKFNIGCKTIDKIYGLKYNDEAVNFTVLFDGANTKKRQPY